MDEQSNEEDEMKKYEYLSQMILSKATEHLRKCQISTMPALEMFDNMEVVE